MTPGQALPEITMRPSALQLFRYSAVTWNSHRIHYDLDWAKQEGHAGLVVHSHLHAANAIRALTEGIGPGWRVDKVAYRIVRSAVAGDVLTASAQLETASEDGNVLEFSLHEINQHGEACLEGIATVSRRP